MTYIKKILSTLAFTFLIVFSSTTSLAALDVRALNTLSDVQIKELKYLSLFKTKNLNKKQAFLFCDPLCICTRKVIDNLLDEGYNINILFYPNKRTYVSEDLILVFASLPTADLDIMYFNYLQIFNKVSKKESKNPFLLKSHLFDFFSDYEPENNCIVKGDVYLNKIEDTMSLLKITEELTVYKN